MGPGSSPSAEAGPPGTASPFVGDGVHNGAMALPDPDPGSRPEAIQTELFRALAVLRALLAVYVVYLNLDRRHDFAHPGLAALGTAVVVLWTGLAALAYESPWRHRAALHVVDLGLVVGLMLATLLTHSEVMQERNAPTLVSFWACVPVLTIAASRGALPAVGAALIVSAADLATRDEPSAGVLRTLMLLLIAAAIVGYGARLVERTADAELRAQRERAAFAERTRVYREIHDGVLQVLALTGRVARDRRDDVELAALAREAAGQEATLRRVIQDTARIGPVGSTGSIGSVDLVSALGALAAQSPGCQVATPAHECPAPAPLAEEVLAATREALINIGKHCPPGTGAWLLLEAEDDVYRLTVRDDGPGIPDGRLEVAAATGHHGVTGSIRGRIADAGGTAELTTGAFGTEWEFTLPRTTAEGE